MRSVMRLVRRKHLDAVSKEQQAIDAWGRALGAVVAVEPEAPPQAGV